VSSTRIAPIKAAPAVTGVEPEFYPYRFGIFVTQQRMELADIGVQQQQTCGFFASQQIERAGIERVDNGKGFIKQLLNCNVQRR
jgi:hypothetical protein